MIDLWGRMGGAEDHPPESGQVFGDGRTGWVCIDDPQGRWFHAEMGGRWVLLRGWPRWAGQSDRPAQALLEAWGGRKEAALEDLYGQFLGVLFDSEAGGVVFVDRLASWPLYYARRADGALLFATRMARLAEMGFELSLDPQGLYDYLYFHTVPAPKTIHWGVFSLRPGRFVTPRSEAEGRYWRLHYEEDASTPFERLRDELLELVKRGVARQAEGAVGAFLSGGTDSSTVTGMLGRVRGEAPDTYSIGFDEPGYDELNYARVAGRHFGARMHEYKVTPEDIVNAIPLIARSYDQPFGNSSAVPTYFCARLAREDGKTRLLAGDGGDELFAGNARYAKQLLFDRYRHLPAVLRKGLVEPLVESPLGGLPGLAKLRSYVRQARIPMPERMETYNLLERLGPENVLTAEFLSQIDPHHPYQILRRAYEDSDARTLLNRMLTLDYQITLADNDLQKVGRMCAVAGIEVAYPLLDDEVVEFAGRVPPEMKLKDQQLRWFFKAALSDFLPRQVIEKKKHGFGLPFGPWIHRYPPLAELVGDSLTDLGRRGIVRRDLIQRLQKDLLGEHPSYYGTLVWVLMMLEQWFSCRGIDGSVVVR